MLQIAAHIGWTEPDFWRIDPTPRQWVRHVEAHNARARQEDERAASIVTTVMNMAGKTLKGERWITVAEYLDGEEEEAGTDAVRSQIMALAAMGKKDPSFAALEPETSSADVMPTEELRVQREAALKFKAQLDAVEAQKRAERRRKKMEAS